MRYREGIEIEKASEEEMLRWQMEHIMKEMSNIEPEQLGACSEALAKLYESLKHRQFSLLLGIMIILFCRLTCQISRFDCFLSLKQYLLYPCRDYQGHGIF